MTRTKVHFVMRPLNEREIPDDVEDKVLAKTYLELAYRLNSEVETDGWDQPPQLILLRVRARDSMQGAEAVVVDGRMIPQFHTLVSNYMRQGGRMHHALLHAAEAWQTMIKLPVFKGIDVSDVKGIALVHEGWALIRSDPEQVREDYERAASERTIHEHPERVECRMIHIAGPDGLRVSINAPRDGVPMHLMGQTRPGMHPSQYQVAGDVPNGLQYTLEVIQGLEPGDWETWQKQYDYELDDLDFGG